MIFTAFMRGGNTDFWNGTFSRGDLHVVSLSFVLFAFFSIYSDSLMETELWPTLISWLLVPRAARIEGMPMRAIGLPPGTLAPESLGLVFGKSAGPLCSKSML